MTPDTRLVLDTAISRLRDEGHVVWGFVVKPDSDEMGFETFCSNSPSRAKFVQMTMDAVSILQDASIRAEAVQEDEEYKLVGDDGKVNEA